MTAQDPPRPTDESERIPGSAGTVERLSIVEIAATPFRLPFTSPFHTAGGALTHRDGLIVRLTTQLGITGVGEASPHPGLGPAALHDVEAALARIAPRLMGAGLPDQRAAGHEDGIDWLDWLADLREEIPPALRCALDTAACDALARTSGVSVARLLGDRIRRAVEVNATIGADTPADAAREARSARADGFRCVKLKVGMRQGIDEERDRVAAVRRALGSEVRLRLDANGAWGVEQAIACIRALEAYDLELVEQPIGPGNLEGMRQVQHAVGTAIAADEDVTGPGAARQVLELGAARILIVKPMVVGGLRAARRIAELAAASAASVVITTTIDAGIGTVAALHLAATLPEDSPACGLATGSLLADDLILTPPAIRGGTMELPGGHGLGVELDEAELARRAQRAGYRAKKS
jgi:o-succinylbenzoate synthase